MIQKEIANLAEAVRDIPDGAVILSSGFGGRQPWRHGPHDHQQ